MAFTISTIADHGTGNPIVARLTLQIFGILDQCNLSKEAAERIKAIYMDSLRKKLMRCWGIAERYRTEFRKELDVYKQRPKNGMIISVPNVLRLEEDCHNFLYEAKSFVRDVLQAFNVLYGTTLVEASEYYPPKKPVKGKQSLIEFAETKFGPNDYKTERFRDMLDTVERIVNYRNAVEHPGGRAGILHIRNFRLDPNGKFSEPGWSIEKDGIKGVESSIGFDLFAMTENLLMLGEEVVVLWAKDNLHFPHLSRIALVPEERRDPNKPILYVVTASAELEQQLVNMKAPPAAGQGIKANDHPRERRL
jgi:hypothetical protein